MPGNQPLRADQLLLSRTRAIPAPIPIPTNAPIEGGPNSTGDRHVLVIDQGSCTLYEMYNVHPHADGSWDAGSGARLAAELERAAPRQLDLGGRRGAAHLPGLVRYDEVAGGVIRHALRFTAHRHPAGLPLARPPLRRLRHRSRTCRRWACACA